MRNEHDSQRLIQFGNHEIAGLARLLMFHEDGLAFAQTHNKDPALCIVVGPIDHRVGLLDGA